MGKMRVWLDDVRPMPPDFHVHCTCADECIDLLSGGDCTHISFDHDLGADVCGTGYDVAKWVEEQAYNGVRVVDTYAVHSANPVGVRNILFAMQNAERMLMG